MISSKKFISACTGAIGLFAFGLLTPAQSAEDASAKIIDLAPFYRLTYATLSGDHARYTDILGRQVIDGLPFQIDGDITLYGQTLLERGRGATRNNPRTVQGIAVGTTFDELHLIHHAAWGDFEGRTIAIVTLHYADGAHTDFPIAYGQHVRGGLRLPSEEKETLTDPGTKIFWRGPTPGSVELHGSGRLFKTTLTNPHPEKRVQTMDLSAGVEPLASYVLIAATTSTRATGRPTTPALPYEADRNFEGQLRVHVVDAVKHLPLTDVLIEAGLKIDDVYVIAAPVLTTETGDAIIRYPANRTSEISFSARKEGSLRNGASWKAGEGDITLELKPGIQKSPKPAKERVAAP